MNDDRTEDNVHYPARFREDMKNPAKRAAEHERQARENRQQDFARLRRIEDDSGGGGKGPVFRLGDRLAAALANGEHIERARKQGVSVGEIDRAFGNRSDRYRLAPGTDLYTDEAREKAARRLMQQARGYLRLAEAIAKLTGKDPDDLKFDVLRRTALWCAPARNATEGDERLEALNLLIHGMAGYLIREENLADLFATLLRTPREDNHSFPDHHEHHYYCSLFEGETPMPGARLARLPAAEMPVSAFPIERTNSGVVKRGEFHGTLRLFRDIRLVIGPTTDAERIGPMFESRPHVDLIPDDEAGESGAEVERKREVYIWEPYHCLEFRTTRPECFKDEGGAIESDTGENVLWTPASLRWKKGVEWGPRREFYLKTEDRARLLGDTCDRRNLDAADSWHIFWRPGPIAETIHPSDDRLNEWTYYWENLLWKPVDVAHIAHFLDRPRVEVQEEVPDQDLMMLSMKGLKDNNVYLDWSAARDSPDPFWFPAGTVAFTVERWIVTGALEQKLRESCAEIRRDLKWRIGERRKKLEERDARLLKAWSGGADREA